MSDPTTPGAPAVRALTAPASACSILAETTSRVEAAYANIEPDGPRTGSHQGKLRGEAIGLLLLVCALTFNAFFLAPELRIGRVPLNDNVLHLALSERLLESFRQGEPFLDPWVAELSLGYPVWRSYQPLPHLVAAAVLGLTDSFCAHPSAFAALQYVLLVLLPLSTYLGARLMGLGSLGSGIAGLLVLAPAGTGDFARYGLGYGATTWRGSGLYTQLFALHLLVLCLGVVTRALDSGRGRPLASLLLAATTLSHIVFGYVAFVSAILLALVGPRGERSRRLVRLGSIVIPALCLVAWFVVPLLSTASEVNHSRWEPAYKWDSFGAGAILSELVYGSLLDGGRSPLLSLFVGLGALIATVFIRDSLPRRLLALAILWLALFFGRATWGHLLLLAGVPADFHLHRLQAAFELAAILVAAWGADRALHVAMERSRALTLVLGVGICAALVTLGIERGAYLNEDARMGAKSLERYEAERGDLERAFAAVRAILAERPGRVSAGKAATWGKDFKVGDVPVYAFLTRAHIDQVSFLYHAMSLTSDIMVVRDEADAAHDVALGVRAVIAPPNVPVPPHLRLVGTYGAFRVYEASSEGYFGLVDIGARYTSPAATFYDPSSAWLASPLLRQGVVVALGQEPQSVPAVAHWEAFPAAATNFLTPRGRILQERKDGEIYSARLQLDRSCYAFVKITWHPDLVATVDGEPASVLRVTPGFAAVPVSAGTHVVEIRYAPGMLRPLLLSLGVLFFFASSLVLRAAAADHAERQLSTRLARYGQRLATARATSALILAALTLLALRPLFRGQLVDGHDALAYPPRVVEFGRALHDGQIPPLWAADLSAGHGQPLFEFAPPLLYAAAYPLFVAGCTLTDSLQFALVVLYTAGAIAVYHLGRRTAASRGAAVAGAAVWLFAPYVALDLYVRAAFAEAAAIAVAPVALLGLLTAMDCPSLVTVAFGAVALSLVPLAHNAVALLLIPTFGVVILAQRRWRALMAGGSVIILSLGLSAFFWLPALIEKRFVKEQLMHAGYFNWQQHGVTVGQLLWTPWGYGLSVPGPADGMSFQIGPLHLLLAAAGAVVAWQVRNLKRRAEVLAFSVVAAIGTWLATSWSAPVWSRLQILQYLQYPWRTLFLPALLLPLLAVPAFDWIGRRLGFCILGILVLANLAHTTPKGFLTFDDEYFAPASIAEKGINTTTFEEYEPRWVERRPSYTSERLTGWNGPLTVRNLSVASGHQEFTVGATVPTVAETATFYYPGWRVYVDGQEVPADPVTERGTISFRIPAGSHHVILQFEPTILRHIATCMTLGTFAALLLAAVATGLVRRWGNLATRKGRVERTPIE